MDAKTPHKPGAPAHTGCARGLLPPVGSSLKEKSPESAIQTQPGGIYDAVILPRYGLPANAAALAHAAGLIIWNRPDGQSVPLPSSNSVVGGLNGAVAVAAGPTQHVCAASSPPPGR